MIYTATKNGHTSTLIVEEGDLKAKRKLSKYRREGWKIAASLAKDADPVSQVTSPEPKPPKRRRRFTTILGRRMALE